jgi:polysaccharide pyruvyl transferase WcaK-like protein
MVIELRGLAFENKGAALMLYAILAKVREELPAAVFVMENSRPASLQQQKAIGVYTKFPLQKYGIPLAGIARIIPRKIMRKFNYVPEQEVEVVLDGSGFAFGDYWGAAKAARRLSSHIQQWKAAGKKVVLLPQAFGTFEQAALRKEMEVILNYADLIFARDPYSYGYLKAIPARQGSIYLKPDFTNLIKGIVPAYFNPQEAEIAIIPNNKLVEAGVFVDRQDYLVFLNSLAGLIAAQGKKAFFLIHEGEKDLALAEDVNALHQQKLKIIREEDPLKVKGMIGQCQAVVTSRFHGLVSALSQGIPCICVGWSHKYKALLEDYHFSAGILEQEELTYPALKTKIKHLFNEEQLRENREKLKAAAKAQEQLSEEMWAQVFKVLKN